MDLAALLADALTDGTFARFEAENASKTAAEVKIAAFVATSPKCGKCRGTGHIREFRHISGGDCFACDGTGVYGGAL